MFGFKSMKKRVILTAILAVCFSCLYAHFNIQYTSRENQYVSMQLVDYTAGTSVVSTETMRSIGKDQGIFWVRIATTKSDILYVQITATPFISQVDSDTKLAYSLYLKDEEQTSLNEGEESIPADCDYKEFGSITVDPASYYVAGTAFLPICGIANLPQTSVDSAPAGAYVSTISIDLVAN